MKKLWSFVAIISVLGLSIIALPQLPSISLTSWGGVFSVVWLFFAGCVIVGHSQNLRKRKAKSYAHLPLRQPRAIQKRVRGQS